MSSYAHHAFTKLNGDRLGEQIFSDFVIKTGKREFPVHKCLLGVMSNFFRGMFVSEMKERYQSYWDAKEFESEIIDAVLNFLYDVPSAITPSNVYLVMEAADYMQIPSLLEHCAKFISTNLTDQNLFQNWQLAKQYRLENLADMCRKYAADNFFVLSRRSEILSLEVSFFEEFLDARSNTTMEERAYETTISWINFDRENRSTYFGQFFEKINLDQIPKSVINSEISTNELVFNNPEASKKLFLVMRKHLMTGNFNQNQGSASTSTLPKSNTTIPVAQETKLSRKAKPTHFMGQTFTVSSTSSTPQNSFQFFQPSLQTKEIVLLGGMTSASYARKYNTKSMQWTHMTDLCDICIEGQLAAFKSLLYVLGGRSANDLNSFVEVWRLKINENGSEWRSCAPMLQKRHRFGCVVFQNRIYVAGGRAHKTEFLSAVESYNLYRDCWKDEPDMNFNRAGCGFVEYRGVLHAIGGQVHQSCVTNTIELFRGNQWVVSESSLNHARSDFGAVVYNNRIYVAGGSFGDKQLSSVEMFCNDKWTYVAPMNIHRTGHVACVIGEEIYIAGGENRRGAVRPMEVFTPELNLWEAIGDIKGDPIGVAMIAM